MKLQDARRAPGAYSMDVDTVLNVAAPGFTGTDQLTYRVFDGTAPSNMATVTICRPDYYDTNHLDDKNAGKGTHRRWQLRGLPDRRHGRLRRRRCRAVQFHGLTVGY